jgi:hypothetical protein
VAPALSVVTSRFLLREKGEIALPPAGVIACGKDGGMRGGEGGVCGGDSTSDSGEAGDSGEVGDSGEAGALCGDTMGEWLSTPFMVDGCVVSSLLKRTSLSLFDLCGSVA